MLHRSLCLGAAIAMASPALAQTGEGTLKALRHVARPLVIVSDSRDDPRVARQMQALDGAKAGLDERDVRVLQAAGPESELRRSLGVAATGFALVLVGKDGSVKTVWHAPVDPQRIYRIIDAMPMRRDEMRH